MHHHRINRIRAVAALIAAPFAGAFALPLHAAQSDATAGYPNKPIRMIAPFVAGAGTDTTARTIALKLSEIWGQQVVVDNRAGAGGLIAFDLVAKANPDGYTLLAASPSFAIQPGISAHLPYDPIKDFAHVTRLVSFPLVFYVTTASPIASLDDLVKRAKANPGALRYGTGGVGTAPHLFGELLNQMAGIKTEAIHYKGSALSVNGLLAGDVEYSASSIATVKAQIEGGKVRALAVSTATSVPTLPGVPPIASVVPGYEAVTFHGLHAPAKTPSAIVAKINRDVVKVMQTAEVKQKFAALSAEVSTTTPEEFAAYIKQQTELWGKVIRTANIRAD